MMKTNAKLRAQAGVMLIEAMVAILIFSLGVLAVIQLQAVSIKQASGAQYRSTAALLANDLVSRMWASDKTPTALQTNFGSSPAGTNYTQWLTTVRNSGLPNVSSNPPTVSFTAGPASATGAASTQATIKVFWKAPGDTDIHNYELVAQLK